MTTHQDKNINVEAVRKTKTETTYEYKPILGQILGYWRVVEQVRAGETVELHLATPLHAYDRLIVNGKEIPIPHEKQNHD